MLVDTQTYPNGERIRVYSRGNHFEVCHELATETAGEFILNECVKKTPDHSVIMQEIERMEEQYNLNYDTEDELGLAFTRFPEDAEQEESDEFDDAPADEFWYTEKQRTDAEGFVAQLFVRVGGVTTPLGEITCATLEELDKYLDVLGFVEG